MFNWNKISAFIYQLLPLAVLPLLIIVNKHELMWDDSALFTSAVQFAQHLFSGNYISAYNALAVYKSTILMLCTIPFGHAAYHPDTFTISLISLNILIFISFASIINIFKRLNVSLLAATVASLLLVSCSTHVEFKGRFIADILFIFSLVLFFLSAINFTVRKEISVADGCIMSFAVFCGFLSKISFLYFFASLIFPLIFIMYKNKNKLISLLYVFFAMIFSCTLLYPGLKMQLHSAKSMSAGVGRIQWSTVEMITNVINIFKKTFFIECVVILFVFVILIYQNVTFKNISIKNIITKKLFFNMYTYCFFSIFIYLAISISSSFLVGQYLTPVALLAVILLLSFFKASIQEIQFNRFFYCVLIFSFFMLFQTGYIYSTKNLVMQINLLNEINYLNKNVICATDSSNLNKDTLSLASHFIGKRQSFNVISFFSNSNTHEKSMEKLFEYDIILFEKPLPKFSWSKSDVARMFNDVKKNRNFYEIENDAAFVFILKKI